MTEAQESDKSPRWGMTIDLNRCVGCQTCTIACKHANDTAPGVQWRKVIDVEQGTFPDVERLFMVVGCQHCAEPPCVPVCPTGATYKRADGIVAMDYDICIGCASCAVACPYQARTIEKEQRWYYGEETRQEKAVAHPERLGVAQKCTFCSDRIDLAQTEGRTPGVDLDVTPACASSCIAQAINFGDFADPDSNVSRLARDNPNFQMHAELGTDPQIKYLYTTPSVPGRDPDDADLDDARLGDPASPLVGQLQTYWDWRAAMNWCMGGVSGGTVVMAWLAYLAGAADSRAVVFAAIAAAALMAVGLFFVFLKIGRQMRAWRALLRPQTSWMTRELYAVLVFYPAVLAGLLWPHPVPFGIAGIAALAFLVCQAKILHMSKGVPAWRVPLIPWMIVATALLEGTALLVLARVAFPAEIAIGLPVVGVGALLAALNAVLWLRYRATAKVQGIGPLARRVLSRASPRLHVIGHAVPFVVFAAIYAAPPGAAGAGEGVLLALAAAAALAGGFFWKFSVITDAAYQQGFALAKMPRRGSGARAAPAPAGTAGGQPEPHAAE